MVVSVEGTVMVVEVTMVVVMEVGIVLSLQYTLTSLIRSYVAPTRSTVEMALK